MSNERGQIAFESLMLVSFIFIGVVFLLSLYLQIGDATVALFVAKSGAIEKINEADTPFVIQGIVFQEQDNGRRIDINIDFAPDGIGLDANSFADTAQTIVNRTKYQTAIINPV
jgi:hypothetical protein